SLIEKLTESYNLSKVNIEKAQDKQKGELSEADRMLLYVKDLYKKGDLHVMLDPIKEENWDQQIDYLCIRLQLCQLDRVTLLQYYYQLEERMAADSDYVFGDVVKVDIQVRGTNKWHMVASGLNRYLRMCAHEEQNISHIKFTFQNEHSISTTNQSSSASNIFNEMMNAAAKKILPNPKPSTNRNDQLYNDILKLLHSKNLGWKYGMQNIL
ncbi:16602_t:CDS:2, partial [Racocetra persica]